MIVLLAMAISAQLVSQWRENGCRGPPDMVFSYDPEYEASEDRYQLLSLVEENYDFGECGFQHRNLTSNCCQESLDSSLKYGSLARADNLTGLPISANQAQYCSVAFTPENMFYIRNGAECVEGYICSATGLQVFSNANCTGRSEQFALNATARVVRSSEVGLFNASFQTFSQGKTAYVWISMVPTSMLVPDFKHTGDIVGTVALSIAFLIQLFVVGYTFKMAMRIRRKTEYIEMYFSLHWLVALCLASIYYYVSFPSIETVAVYAGIAWPFINLGTLIPVIMTVSFVYQVSPPKSQSKVWLSYFAVLLLHIALGGAYYIQYWYELESWALYNDWKQFYPLWIIFSFGVIFVPIYMGFVRLNNGQRVSMGKMVKAMSKDLYMTGAFLLFVITLLIYVIVYLHLTLLDLVLGDDLMYFGVLQLTLLCYTLLYLCKLLMKTRISALYLEHLTANKAHL